MKYNFVIYILFLTLFIAKNTICNTKWFIGNDQRLYTISTENSPYSKIHRFTFYTFGMRHYVFTIDAHALKISSDRKTITAIYENGPNLVLQAKNCLTRNTNHLRTHLEG